MHRQWTAAPAGLRVLAILGTAWFVAGLLIGLALLVLPGPGLAVLLLASLGVAPWIWIAVRDDGGAPGGSRTRS